MFLEIHRGGLALLAAAWASFLRAFSISFSSFYPIANRHIREPGGRVLFCRADGDRRSDGAGALLLEPALSLLIGKCWRVDS